MVAPIIPGLTDHEVPAILKAVAEAGARNAGFILLRLPHAVSPLFEEWVQAHFPERAPRVLGRIRDNRSGRMNDPRFKSRMRGEGEYAAQIESLFRVCCEKVGLNKVRRTLSTAAWRGATAGDRGSRTQLGLF
jgi:DNA repair photolyase